MHFSPRPAPLSAGLSLFQQVLKSGQKELFLFHKGYFLSQRSYPLGNIYDFPSHGLAGIGQKDYFLAHDRYFLSQRNYPGGNIYDFLSRRPAGTGQKDNFLSHRGNPLGNSFGFLSHKLPGMDGMTTRREEVTEWQ
jgi:hypothetical protein